MPYYLGLFHMQDEYPRFGFLDNGLEDTEPEKHSENLMETTSQVYGNLVLSNSQIAVLKAHPNFYE